jgi:hypothetical protein
MKTYRITFFTTTGNYHQNQTADKSSIIQGIADGDWFLVTNKNGNTTMINKQYVQNVVISEVKEEEKIQPIKLKEKKK